MTDSLDLTSDPVELTAALVDIPSVSGSEKNIADAVEQALRAQAPHLEVVRNGEAVLARTDLGRGTRVVLAGHLDTVPVNDNLPSRRTGSGADELLHGCGTIDMKSGDAVMLNLAATLTEPRYDLTFVLYDCEEIEAERNGLGRIERELPEWLDGDLAVVCEPSNAAIEAGCAGVRINPGNIRKHDKVRVIGDAAKERGIPIRIGVNGGSLDPELLAKHGGVTPEALVESALSEAALLEDVAFGDIAISVKHSDPWVMVQTYRLLADACDYPLHLGVTEAGPAKTGSIKSAVGIGALLAEGIGDTIRVSLSADPVEEVKAGILILESLHLRERGLDVVSCPSCARAEVDVYTLAEQVQQGLEGIDVPLRVAVMGCVVNGPGEAREADLGVAAGKGKGQIIRRGEVLYTVAEADIVEALVHFANEMADEIRAERGEGDPVVVA